MILNNLKKKNFIFLFALSISLLMFISCSNKYTKPEYETVDIDPSYSGTYVSDPIITEIGGKWFWWVSVKDGKASFAANRDEKATPKFDIYVAVSEKSVGKYDYYSKNKLAASFNFSNVLVFRISKDYASIAPKELTDKDFTLNRK